MNWFLPSSNSVKKIQKKGEESPHFLLDIHAKTQRRNAPTRCQLKQNPKKLTGIPMVQSMCLNALYMQEGIYIGSNASQCVKSGEMRAPIMCIALMRAETIFTFHV